MGAQTEIAVILRCQSVIREGQIAEGYIWVFCLVGLAGCRLVE